MEARKKTRDLSVAEYFIQVQKEYLIADFRRKIYFNPKDKAYYSRVIKYKEKRINDIAKRNNLLSILNDEGTLSSLRQELFTENGYPLFPMNEIDIVNYYSVGNSFSYNRQIYVLREIKEGDAVVERNGQKFLVSKDEIFRIL